MSLCDTAYGHTMPKEFVLVQERSQLRAYRTDTPDPEGRGFEVYVYNLPRDILIQYVYKFMQQCGEIYDVRFLMDFSGFNRGMCYVKFLTRMAARKAVLIHDACDIVPNHPVYIRISFDNNKLYMRNVPKNVSTAEICEHIDSIVGEKILKISFEEQFDDKNSRCCFLTYENHRKALEARKKLWPSVELWNATVSVEWAEPPELKLSRVLYFKNFPENATRLELFEALNTSVDISTVLKIRVENGTGCIVFTGLETRKEGHRILSDSSILGRRLYLSFKRFPIFRKPPSIKDVAVRGPHKENKEPNLNYKSCAKTTLDQLPLFHLNATYASPGFYNELQIIQDGIHAFLEEEFPNSSWTCLDPEQQEVPSHICAIRVRPTVNNEIYEFVLLCVSSELASGCAGFN